MAEMEITSPVEKSSLADRIVRVEFAKQTYPEFIAQKNKDWVLYGDDNDYLKYLMDLFDRNAEHNSILTAKANYISGKGFSYDKKLEDPKQLAKLESFLSYANRFEDWNDLLPKMSLDLELFNGYALQVVFGMGSKPEEVYHIQFNRIRISKDGKTAYYCEDWTKSRPDLDPSFKSFPLFNNETKKGTAILYYKVYRPTSKKYGNVYPVPDYIGCTSDIETDINITAFHYSNTEEGFSAPGMLNFYNGEPTEEDKRKIVKKFQKKHTGTNNAGSLVFNFVNEGQKGVEFVEFPIDRLDKMFEQLAKRIQQKIFTGHKVTNPVLFGIKTEGQLGNRNELIEAFEHFTNTYINLRQTHILNTVHLIAERKGVMYEEIYIEPTEPIGLEIPFSDQEVANSLTFDEKRMYIAKKYNLELTATDSDQDKRLTIANKLGVGGTASLMEVIKDTTIDPNRKAFIINALFGISLKKAQLMLGFTPEQTTPTVATQKMSSDKDVILEMLLACATPDNDDEVLEVNCVESGTEQFEKMQAHKFADVEVEVKTVRNKILEILSGSPETKPEVLAKQLGLDVDYVNEQINYLIDKKLILESEAGFNVTDKGINKAEDLEPVLEMEVYTVYKYEERENVPAAESGSRKFCKDLMASKGTWTREQIESISSKTGENVWVYRGGFYTNPDTNKTTPYCRHIWKAYTKTRRKK